MSEDQTALPLRSQVEQYWIHDVEFIGTETITYRAEDMRLNRKVWLQEFFPRDLARRHFRDDGTYTVYAHPAHSAEFEEQKEVFNARIEGLEGIDHPSIPALVQRFESSGSAYVALLYNDDFRSLSELSLSEERIAALGRSAVEALELLHSRNLEPPVMDIDSVRATGESQLLFPGWTEWQDAAEQPEEMLESLGNLLAGLMRGECSNGEEALEPLQPDARYSAAICGVLNRMRSAEPESRFRSYREVQVLLQNTVPDEKACEPLVCERPPSILSTAVRLAVMGVVALFAYHVLTRPETVTGAELSWVDAKRIEMMAHLGSVEAQQSLGQMFEKGYGVGKDALQAKRWYEEAAKRGSLDAQLHLGYLYFQGEELPRDMRQSAYWYRQAAEQGDMKAQYYTGYFFAAGEGVKLDRRLAKIWLQRAVDQGSEPARDMLTELVMIDAWEASKTRLQKGEAPEEQLDPQEQYRRAYGYFTGQGTEQDYDEAFRLAKMAAEAGESRAYYIVGSLYKLGYGVKKNSREAVRWLEKDSDSVNSPRSWKLLGDLYRAGDGISRDYAKAMMWYRKAAETGNADAEYAVGRMYELGEGVAANARKALEWYERAGSRNHPKALRRAEAISKSFEKGKAQKKEPKDPLVYGDVEAIFQKAISGDPAALYDMGMIYEKGYQRPPDPYKARDWYQQAAGKGHREAQYRLGQMFRYGLGIHENLPQAAKWYEKAARQGHAKAQNRLGTMYAVGKGVKRDGSIAKEWFLKSARQGNAHAQYNLGKLYEGGNIGVKANRAEAYRWYARAVENGYEKARDRMKWLERYAIRH